MSILEKTQYKILLTILASKDSLSFSQLKKILPSIQENRLDYHLKLLKDSNLIINESSSFYSLTRKSLNLLEILRLTNVKSEFAALFNIFFFKNEDINRKS